MAEEGFELELEDDRQALPASSGTSGNPRSSRYATSGLGKASGSIVECLTSMAPDRFPAPVASAASTLGTSIGAGMDKRGGSGSGGTATAGEAGEQPPAPPPPIVFEGTGLTEVGTARKADDVDDEFDYVFEGGQREGQFHKQVFRAKAMPAHLVTNVKQQLIGEVLEEDEEEEEEDEEEEEQDLSPDAEVQESDEPDDDIVIDDMPADGSMLPPEVEQGISSVPLSARSDHHTSHSELTREGTSTSKPSHHSELLNSQPTINTEDVELQNSSTAGESSKQSIPNQPNASWTSFSPSENGAGDEAVEEPTLQNLAQDEEEELPSFRVIQALSGATASSQHQHGGGTHTGPTTSITGLMESDAVTGGTFTTGNNTTPKLLTVTASGKVGKRVPDPDLANLNLEPSTSTAVNATISPPAAAGAGVEGRGGAPAEAEWEEANKERMAEIERKASALHPGGVSYHEALLHFMTSEYAALKAQVQSSLPPKPSLLARILCIAPPPLKPLLAEQKLQLLCLARTPFSNSEPMHLQLLSSLFAAFTGRSVDQPRFGPHWGQIGFQGDDPATDLRGCGMLGLLHLFYLHQADAARAAHVFRLSRHPVQEFPLAVVSLNVTLWSIQLVREGGLHTEANARGSIVEAAQDFYVGTMYTFYARWLAGGKTMRDSGFVLKDLEAHAKKHPKEMVSACNMNLQPAP